MVNLVEEKDGKYITIFSSDDKWELDKLEKQVQILENHPEYKCCFTWDKMLLDIEDHYKDRQDYSHKENRNRYDCLDYYFQNGNCMNACSALMDKSVFYELGKMDMNFRVLADYRLWLQLACKYPFFVLNEELTFYRRHDNNISRFSVETIVRTANEEYRTYSQLFRKIDKDTFYKSFYCHLAYSGALKEEQFLADKFILLLNSAQRTYEQVAMQLYFDSCDNQKFLDCLEERYGFKPGNFVELTGKGGLQYFVEEIVHKCRTVVMKNQFTPAHILLRALDKGELHEDSIDNFIYSTMICLVENTEILAFDMINNMIMQLRQRRMEKAANKKVVFLIGEKSKMDMETEFSHIIGNPENICLFAVVPSKESMFLEKQNDSCQWAKIAKLEHFSIYDEWEHRVKFLSELEITADIIYYVDCLSEEYTCMDMIAGYPLSTRNVGVVSEKEYSDMLQENKKIKLFDEIYTYGE